MDRFPIIKEFFAFLFSRKRWVLIPVILILLGLGILVTLSQGSTVAPLIYTIF